MNEKIICIGILSMFLLTTLSASSTNIIKTMQVDDLNDGKITTITVHAFFDIDGDCEQDPFEGDAVNFYVFAKGNTGPYDWSEHLVGRTDENGNLTFKYQEDGVGGDGIFIHVRNKLVWIAPDQFKGSIRELPDGVPIYDGVVFTIPCRFVEFESHSKSVIQNIFSLFFNRFPLLQQLLGL
jgi:hypothetical protein